MCGPWLDYSSSKLEFLETCDTMDVAWIVDDVVELFIYFLNRCDQETVVMSRRSLFLGDSTAVFRGNVVGTMLAATYLQMAQPKQSIKR